MTGEKAGKALVIGGGCAGLTAALYLARAGHPTSVLCGYAPSSISESPTVENFPGFPGGIPGDELVRRMRMQCERQGASLIDAEAVRISPERNLVIDDCGGEWEYDGLVIATGSSPNSLPSLEGVSEGVHYCALCDGSLYAGKDVAVIGGGDTALSDALYLSSVAEHVTMIVRRDSFRGSAAMSDCVMSRENVSVMWNSEVSGAENDGGRIRLSVSVGGSVRDVFEDGVFVAVGNRPNNGLVLSSFGSEEAVSEYPRVRICGDCADNGFRQAVVACAEGAKAAISLSSAMVMGS